MPHTRPFMAFEMFRAVELCITVTTLEFSTIYSHLVHLKAFCCHLVNVFGRGRARNFCFAGKKIFAHAFYLPRNMIFNKYTVNIRKYTIFSYAYIIYVYYIIIFIARLTLPLTTMILYL